MLTHSQLQCGLFLVVYTINLKFFTLLLYLIFLLSHQLSSNAEFLQNDESQSSMISTASASTSAAATESSNQTGTAKKRSKIEVSDPEGYAYIFYH